jgi:type IV pilus assembly protein PilA
LIELMIVVAIVGILAAIALPAYRDYRIRSRVSEAVAAIAECKTSVREFVAVKQRWPDDINRAGCNSQYSQYVSGMTVSMFDGRIMAQATNTGVPDCQLFLNPQGGPTTPITGWTGSTSCEFRYVPPNFRVEAH